VDSADPGWLPFSWVDAPFGGFFSGPDGTIAIFPFTPTRPPANARRVALPICLLIRSTCRAAG